MKYLLMNAVASLKSDMCCAFHDSSSIFAVVGTKLTNGRMGEWDIFENIHQCVVNHHSSCEIKLFLQ